MADISGGTVIKAAVVAGLLAGLLLGLFHLVVTEPVMDRAIAHEERQARSQGRYEPEVVSRDTQKVGLVVGAVLYGMFLGMVFGGVYALARGKLLGRGHWQKGLALAGLGFASIALFPFIKYPANPPGVGDLETLSFRVTMQLLLIGLSVAGAAGALALYRALGRKRGIGPWGRWLLALGAGAAYAAVVYVLMPENPDQVRIPGGLVFQFRVLSLAGLALLWGVLGLLFGLFGRLFASREAPERDVRRAVDALP